MSPQNPEPQISEARRQTVERARQLWVRKLIDPSRRNNLLYYRPLKTGTLDISGADQNEVAALFSGEGVAARKLLPHYDEKALSNTLRDIARRAMENQEEKGLNTLFLAIGLATWPAEDEGRPVESPVLLLPVGISQKEGTRSLQLTRTGHAQINLVLLHFLAQEFEVRLDADALLTEFADEEDQGAIFDLQALYDAIKSQMADTIGFEIRPSLILGNFAFQKLAMVKDLQDCAATLAGHDMIAAIAGDGEAKIAITSAQKDLDPKELDQVPPENEFIVLDADSSQQSAIASVFRGQSRVIHGPPGTGKSQTITNLITSLAATGNRVLFVAEKKAALDVVKRRLEEVGLGHLAIDLHGADLSPKKVMQQVARTLEVVRTSVPADCQLVHGQFVDRRKRLNDHVERMHSRREPTGLSVYEMQGRLLRLGNAMNSSIRWRGPELARLTPANGRRITDLLGEAGDLSSLFLRIDPSPWTGAVLADGAALQKALDLVRSMHEETFPNFLATSEHLAKFGLKRPDSVAEIQELANLVESVEATFKIYSPDIYQWDLDALLAALAPGRAGGIAGLWALCMKSHYRRARKTVLSFRLGGKASAQRLFTEVSTASSHLLRWRALATAQAAPQPVENSTIHIQRLRRLAQELGTLAIILPSKRLDQASIDESERLVTALLADQRTPAQIPRLTQVENDLEAAGVGKLSVDIRSRKPDAKLWPSIYQHAWLMSTLDAVSQQDPEIRGFMGTTHGRYVDDFERLDEERISLAADRVRRAHGERAVAAMNANPTAEQLIRAEVTKARKHLPLRKVFAQAADVLTAVCPCWMASPLSVSQLLDSGRQYFDFVIFDEASQVVPENAAPSILRGKNLVVAGDSKQLPPTAFFAAGDEDDYVADEEAFATEGYESLLDMMNSFLNGSYLDWHYRSKDESLISFSNHYLYQDRLVTFPGPGGVPSLSHVLVQQELGVDGQDESSSQEVQKVVSLILEHARSSPDLTLGVITMGIRHMNRIQAALDRALETNGELGTFFDTNRRERFFIKNLERVQGDERDAIIISIGYGKDRGGNLPLRFGPLIPEGGRRRLNVAITRARQKLTVVSSFSHFDLDVARVRPGSGVELLRNYLQYAASNGKRLGDGEITTIPLNNFEADVFDSLSARGMKLIPQLGVSRFRLDMAAQHPEQLGRFVLAIECDGATYHSSNTARDRDRLRQQQLENLGWRFHRIWSTDWFMRKEDEIKRAMSVFQEAVKFADRLDQGAVQNGQSEVGNHHNSPVTLQRGPRPAVPVRTSINQYQQSELVALLKWLASDGQLRTDDQVIEEMISILGFSRRGTRITDAIQNAINIWRAGDQK